MLDEPLVRSGLPGAPILARNARRLRLQTVRDLLFHLPRAYHDLREMQSLGDLTWTADGTVVSARVRVADIHVEPGFRRRIQRTVATFEDDTGTIQATWFGRRYIERRLHAGDRIVVSGKIKHFGRRLSLDNPEFQPDADDATLLHVGRIVPVYRLTAGLTAARLRTAIRIALDRIGKDYPEYLPASIASDEGLVSIGAALDSAHYPETFEGRDAALGRLAFDELLALQLGMVGRRRQRGLTAGRPFTVQTDEDERIRAAIVASLARKTGRDVSLTDDQRESMDAVRADLGQTTPMLRLLQGDVGSGKTAVAAQALAIVALAGGQGALLAPTDLLARQHAVTLGDLLADLSIPVTLLTGSLPAGERRHREALVASGQAPVVVGTHALLSESVEFQALGLAVVDEQHRFGVEQRGQLEAKAAQPPHVLLMTATPIPRTLGQVLYADLDVSNLRTPPAGRIPITTLVRHPDSLDRLWDFVAAEAKDGHRTFVVVPRISDDSDAEDADGSGLEGEEPEPGGDAAAPAAEAEAERLRAVLNEPDRLGRVGLDRPLRVGLVHGRLRPADRDAEMARFRDGELDVLVGTTVVEVGVDVAEATVMVVEAADRFGLAQLHQLRGRVGRGTDRSWCALVSTAAPSTAAWDALVAERQTPQTTEQARIVAVARTTDGFALAEADFELRREGDVLGLAQSGLPQLRVATLARSDHRELAVRARTRAEELLDDSGRLPATAETLRAELEHGWLRNVWVGDPETAA